MKDSALTPTQQELLDTYGGTVMETIARQLVAADNPGQDPDARPGILIGLPWWTMKIGKSLKVLPLLAEAWWEGHDKGLEDAFDPSKEPVKNPYEQEARRGA